jgi:hypothetical protein
LYTLNTDPDFRIILIQGGNQIIFYPNGIPTTKEVVDLYFQHKTVKDGVRGNITVTMSKWIDQMKDMGSYFCIYLNREKVYASQAALGLVDACIIGVFLQANQTLMSRYSNMKEAIMEAMSDTTPISNFSKRVKEPPHDNMKVLFTKGLAIQVTIDDPKKAGEYTEIMYNAMDYFNENGCHPILYSKVFLPFGRSTAIDNETFCKLIRAKLTPTQHKTC